MTKQFALKHDDKYATRFLHIRSTNFQPFTSKRTHDNKLDLSYGGYTIAYNPLLIVDKNFDVTVCVEVGIARCRGGDRYVKRVGRGISLVNLQIKTPNLYGLLFLGTDETIPLRTTESGDMYVDERRFNLREAIARNLGFMV